MNPDDDAPFALVNLDMIATSPLYLTVSRPGCVSSRRLLEEFLVFFFLRESVLGS